MDAERRIAELEGRLRGQAFQSAEQAAIVAEQTAQIETLTKQVEALAARLGLNSTNSSKPPSTDTPSQRAARNKAKAERNKKKRKRGAQKGHRGAHRQLVPSERVDKLLHLFPEHCECCAASLPQVQDPRAKRHQHAELPKVRAFITEWQLHAVTCACGHRTRRRFVDADIPKLAFGPRLMATIGLLTGVYHLSRRKTVTLLHELLGVDVSLGAVSEVEARVSDSLQHPTEEVWQQVVGAEVKHTDGTSWLKSGKLLSLWTLATSAATYFKIVADGRRDTLKPLYGKLIGILISDRATALKFWAMERRQVCWAHLLRKFVGFSERDGPAGKFGRELLDLTGLLFEYHHEYRDGKLTKERYVAWMAPVQQQVETALQCAVDAKIHGVSGACKDMLEHRDALWTFVNRDDVDPTNNHAERELRAFVLWRRRSFGTQSERGNRFAERVMTIAATARKQERPVLSFLTACCIALRDGTAAPSLLSDVA